MNIEKIEKGITKLKRRVNELEQLRANHARHDDPAVEVVEAAIPNTILEVFGSSSPEYKQYQNHEIRYGAFNIDEDQQPKFVKGIEHSIAAMNGLISRLEEKKEDLSLSVQSTQAEHVVKGEGVSDWNRDFYRLLEDGGWIRYTTYRSWFGNFNIKKQRLIAALDNEKVKFRFDPDSSNYRAKLKMRERVFPSKDSLWRRKIIELSFEDIVIEAESFLAWLKENYPLEETEQMKTVETAEDTTSDNLQADSQGLLLPLEHEYESSLLKIAVECWKALYEDAGPDGKKIRKPQIEKWVEEHYSEVSANSRKTIATVVNPFKKGGATSSE